MSATNPITDDSVGMLKIEFKDAGGANLAPASISSGTLFGAGNPWVGAISNQVNNASTVGLWIDAQVQAVAPVGTVAVGVYLLNINFFAPSTIHFDVIPEPSTYAFIGGLLALGLVIYRRRLKA